MKNIEIRQTADGSKTLYLPELDETYHSSHGAMQEAMHVFIQHGLAFIGQEKKSISVFEMGFGTGLNALLTAQWAEQHSCSIRYIGIELHPIPKDIWQQMDYVQEVLERERYSKIMAAEWGEYQVIEPNFQLKKVEEDILGLQLVEQVDLIYFDAFGPRAQSEMWDLPVLTKMYERLNPGGVFVTYCAQGQMKRNLKSLGFSLESLPGPPGKREMTRAIKI
ncbi:MAG: tRNA (5-methylaminomethyl-2-thiouridine)(34)-methyltransferase MnmD [Crocinitomicaceae bacterium]|nr:tRNA (5-methylaminomethyl-2-thiouridine)(34)-methyltransferase MnmD [Crocinitomicaceae bacterium]MBP6031900.1 tRNA (5-methylaminomethyl-2-thiouridine)(34)-methyltransferase MnmD [Crocinitomicaceae bacterium]